MFLSAGERQSRELMQKVRQHCSALSIASEYVGGPSFHDARARHLELKLPGGVRVLALPANSMTARGFTGDVFLDEFAMHGDDREIWAAMFPTLLRGGGELDVASTPRGRQNVFYELSKNDSFHHSTVSIRDAVSQGLDVDVDAIREAMGDAELFSQEFECAFLDEATAFLTLSAIDACMDDELTPADSVAALSRDGRDLFVGVDIGRVRDLTVIWVLAREGDELITAGLFELSQAAFAVQLSLLEEVLSLRQVRRCAVDSGGMGMPLAESLHSRFGDHRVEAVQFTAERKSEMAASLRVAIERGGIRLPRCAAIRRDFHSVERTVSGRGHFVLSAPRREGSHADRFWAAALAVRAAGDGARGSAELLKGPDISFARSGAW